MNGLILNILQNVTVEAMVQIIVPLVPVLAAGGTEVSSSQELLKIRRQLYVGDRITMTLWRDGERLEVTLELTEAAE